MAWLPIALTVPQYEDPADGAPYSGAVLKAYESGTSTNTVLATDSTGGTTAGSMALNASGYPEVSGSVVIPHIDQVYKLALYPTQTAADADSGAIWTVDSIDPGITSRVVNVLDEGVVADNATDDATAFQAAIDLAITNNSTLHIPYGQYYFASKLTFSGPINVTCDRRALMRWDGLAAAVGIAFNFEDSTDQLVQMDFPCLFGPAHSSGFSIPGYSTGTQDLTSRVGNALNLRGGNRISLSAHIINGFENGIYVESTALSTVDNVNFDLNTSDFCENTIHLDSTEGFGIAQFVATVNTAWAKTPVRITATSGYVNAAAIRINGTAFVNEIGGSGVYVSGVELRSSTFFINQIQAGWRSDSTTDSPILLTPTGTMAASPVEAETITQAGSGATGVVVTNADVTKSTTLPFTVQAVTGTFNLTGELTGSTSGALGAGSVPSSQRGFTAPWLAGDQTSNSVTFDAEQTGLLGYCGSKHCDFVFGAPMNHPTGSTDGAFSVFPVAGESVRIRDNGVHNSVKVISASAEASDGALTAYTLSTTIGEANFTGGVGSAPYADWVYCYISADSLAAGSVLTRYLYHSKINDNNTLTPVAVRFQTTGGNKRNLDCALIAHANAGTNNRQILVELKNTSSTALETTQDVFFFVGVGEDT